MRKLLILSALFLTILSSCYYDTDEALFPQLSLKECDTTVFTYSGSIRNIINDNCIECHGSLDKPFLNSYNDVFANGIDIYGQISTGKMPPNNSAKLKDCQITQFKKWMDAGMPNN